MALYLKEISKALLKNRHESIRKQPKCIISNYNTPNDPDKTFDSTLSDIKKT